MTTGRWAAVALVAVTGGWAALSCLDPTQVTLSLSTNAKCTGGFGTNVYLGTDPTVSATSDQCTTVDDRHNAIGTIVLVPGASGSSRVTVRVVGTMDPLSTSADRCGQLFDQASLSAAEKMELRPCIEARRALSFIAHSMLRLPVSLDAACAGVVCQDTQTCVDGKCVDDTVDCSVSGTCADPDAGDVDGGTDASPAPPAVPTSIYANGDATCVITGRGFVQCWGGNNGGKMGIATPDVVPTPINVGLFGLTSLALGATHGCGFDPVSVICWGDNSHGEVDPTMPGVTTVGPVTLTSPTLATSIAVGAAHSCAVAASGGTPSGVFCWGDGSKNQLGPSPTGSPTEVKLPGPPRTVAAGADHTCALYDNGQTGLVYCWGLSTSGQAGIDGLGQPIKDLNSAILKSDVFVAAGANQSAAGTIKSLYWWGDDTADKSSGSSFGGKSYNPAATQSGAMAAADTVTIGDDHVCGLSSGTVTCWGDNLGQLGGNSSNLSQDAFTLKLTGVKGIAAGRLHTCAIAPSSQDVTRETVWCWGDNAKNQLGGAASGSASVDPVELTLAPEPP